MTDDLPVFLRHQRNHPLGSRTEDVDQIRFAVALERRSVQRVDSSVIVPFFTTNSHTRLASS